MLHVSDFAVSETCCILIIFRLHLKKFIFMTYQRSALANNFLEGLPNKQLGLRGSSLLLQACKVDLVSIFICF